MNEFNMVPIYRQGINELSEGLDIYVPSFCAKNCYTSDKCIEYYKRIFDSAEGLYVCPFGFNTYILKQEEGAVIFTCFRIKDKYDKKKVDPKLKDEAIANDHYRIITEDAFNKYLIAYKEFYKNTRKYDLYSNFVEDVLHDIRKYNGQMKLTVGNIYRSVEGKSNKYSKFISYSKTLQEIAWFFTLRLNNYDFTYNEKLMSANQKTSYNVYAVFDKVRRCIKERAEVNNINIKINSYNYTCNIMAYECIELLPYILLDNAIKYAPSYSEINIIFKSSGDSINIIVMSVGPQIGVNEINKIFKRGYRSANAEKLTKDGQGIGLHTAKKICDLHSANISLSSSDKIVLNHQNIDYSEFCVDISMSL